MTCQKPPAANSSMLMTSVVQSRADHFQKSKVRCHQTHLLWQLLKHERYPVYLGVTLSYRQHLQKTAAKVKTRNSLLSKLAGSTWGANATTLRTSALALCYSAAEYCCPLWSRSAHTGLVDAQLNSTMRLISSTLRPTQVAWLPVLSNITPPNIRR